MRSVEGFAERPAEGSHHPQSVFPLVVGMTVFFAGSMNHLTQHPRKSVSALPPAAPVMPQDVVIASVDVSVEHAEDNPLALSLYASPQDYEEFARRDPPDIAALPDGELAIGGSAHIIVQDAEHNVWRKVSMCYHPVNSGDSLDQIIECDGRKFRMMYEKLSGFGAGNISRVGTRSLRKEKEILESEVTVGFKRMRPKSTSSLTLHQLRDICRDLIAGRSGETVIDDGVRKIWFEEVREKGDVQEIEE